MLLKFYSNNGSKARHNQIISCWKVEYLLTKNHKPPLCEGFWVGFSNHCRQIETKHIIFKSSHRDFVVILIFLLIYCLFCCMSQSMGLKMAEELSFLSPLIFSLALGYIFILISGVIALSQYFSEWLTKIANWSLIYQRHSEEYVHPSILHK